MGQHFSTTKAARDLMPRVVEVLQDVIDDPTQGGIARVNAAKELVKLAKLEQIPEPIDNIVNLVVSGSEKVISINAGEPNSNAAAN